MSYFTKTDARLAAQRAGGLQKSAPRTFDSILKEEVRAASDADTFDIFLSHSIHDAELVTGVKQLLTELGYKVYVDWSDDPHLDRRTVSKENAALLRRRMRQSRSLVYIATDNATSSKWMPWELGFFDGHRPGHVAVMPVLDQENSSFKGQEYIGLYPIVEKSTYKDGRPDVFVEEKGVGGQWTTLSELGHGKANWRPYTN